MTNRELYEAALEAAQKAYAPYSHFQVGAALLLDDGTLLTGNNQENSSYPLSMCAERVVIDYALANFPERKILRIAIASPSTEQILTPCGGCRQVLAEAVKRQNGTQIEVIMSSPTHLKIATVTDLLPLTFTL